MPALVAVQIKPVAHHQVFALLYSSLVTTCI